MKKVTLCELSVIFDVAGDGSKKIKWTSDLIGAETFFTNCCHRLTEILLKEILLTRLGKFSI